MTSFETRHELENFKKDNLALKIEIQKLRTEKQNFEKEIQILNKTRLDKSVEQENIELKKSQNESQNLENCKKDNLALKIEIRKLRSDLDSSFFGMSLLSLDEALCVSDVELVWKCNF